MLWALDLIPNYLYDGWRYLIHSATLGGSTDPDKLRGLIMQDAHRLEKGMALPHARPGFGLEVAQGLVQSLGRFVQLHGWDASAAMALNVLERYLTWRTASGEDGELRQRTALLRETLDGTSCQISSGGTVTISAADIRRSVDEGFDSLARTRHSIRHFGTTPVPGELINAAVATAQYTPSVCNRQAWRAHVFDDPAMREEVLALQNGNAGFGDTSSHVIAITADMRYFVGPSERSQAYVDGGLFAMSLVYALHSRGAATCFLNWSATAGRDKRMHRVAGIPQHEVIVTLLAVGSLSEGEFAVAESPRRELDAIVRWHSP